MPIEPGSTVPRRQFGRHLRQLREEAQLTIKIVAEELEWSAPKIWRIEGGDVHAGARRPGHVSPVRGIAGHDRGVDGAGPRDEGEGLVARVRRRHPAYFELYVTLASAASRLRQYGPELIPGLLQSAAYATEVFQVNHSDMPADEVRRGVAVRLARQQLLTRSRPPAPRLEAIVEEASLRRSLRDRAAMTEQFRSLLRIGRLPNVCIRVLPLGAGLHRGAMAGGSFTILDFPDHGRARGVEPSTVYSDGLTGALYLDKPDEVAAYENLWASIVGSTLDETESMRLITAIAKEHPSP